MKKTKYRRLAAMAASLLCCLIFTVPAYAQSSEPQPEATPAPVDVYKRQKIFPPRKHPPKSPECQAFGGDKS